MEDSWVEADAHRGTVHCHRKTWYYLGLPIVEDYTETLGDITKKSRVWFNQVTRWADD